MGVCEWPVDYADCGPCSALSSLPVSGQELFEEMAAEYLWRWTGQKFGLCESTIRPCRQNCTEGVSTYGSSAGSPWSPALIGGKWFNISCGGGCGDTCGCSSVSTLVFERPVAEIVSIVVDGVTLPESAYRVDNSRLLVRQDGGSWPYCQNMGRAPGSPDTWTITLRTGAAVPAGGRLAAGKLACELARAACGDKGCELPQRWQSISRQGVTVSAAIDLFEGLDEGKTGVWLIDSWVASVVKPDIGFSLASPDARSQSRRTTYPSSPASPRPPVDGGTPWSPGPGFFDGGSP